MIPSLRVVVAGAAIVLGLGTVTAVPVVSTAAPAAVGPVKVVHRAYGDGPVRQDAPGQDVRIHFSGHAGDRVALTQSIAGRARAVLRHRGGGQVPPWAGGYVALPRTGRYVFTWSDPGRHPGVRAQVQLVKLRLRDAVVDATPEPLPQRVGFAWGFRVRVPASGMITVREGLATISRLRAVVGPDGPVFRDRRMDAVLLEAGSRPAAFWPPGWTSARGTARAGATYVVLTEKGTRPLTLTRTRTGVAAVDGPAFSFPSATVPGGASEIRFQGTAGQWVHPVVAATVIRQRLTPTLLVAPSGAYLTDNAVPDLWRLPVTGEYRLVVLPRHADEPLTGMAHLDGVTTAGPAPDDGSPVTLGTTAPGRYVVADIEGTALVRVTLDPTPPGSWLLYAGRESFSDCGPRDPAGCGDDDLDVLSSANPGPSLLVAPGWLVLAVPPDEQATVTARVVAP